MPSRTPARPDWRDGRASETEGLQGGRGSSASQRSTVASRQPRASPLQPGIQGCARKAFTDGRAGVKTAEDAQPHGMPAHPMGES
eukprot:scaffold3644_cov107-Isochrysis_galbana.AAC.6